jgi:hypothetical protein
MLFHNFDFTALAVLWITFFTGFLFFYLPFKDGLILLTCNTKRGGINTMMEKLKGYFKNPIATFLVKTVLVLLLVVVGFHWSFNQQHQLTIDNKPAAAEQGVVRPGNIADVVKQTEPDLKTIIGIILSLVGLGIMSLSGNMTINKGDVLTFLGAAVFAAQILLVDRYTQEVDIVLLTCLELLVVGLGSAIPAAAIEGFRFTITTTMVVAIVFTAIFSTAIALTVQNKVQPFTDPTHAAIIYLAEPVFGAIFSLFIGDKLGGRTLFGCIFILIGMLAINVKAE